MFLNILTYSLLLNAPLLMFSISIYSYSISPPAPFLGKQNHLLLLYLRVIDAFMEMDFLLVPQAQKEILEWTKKGSNSKKRLLMQENEQKHIKRMKTLPEAEIFNFKTKERVLLFFF